MKEPDADPVGSPSPAGSPGWRPADWPAPSNVRAGTTTRAGGVSTGAWASLNLASHVGDAPAAVSTNRARLRRALDLPDEPWWLEQCHGTRVATWGEPDRVADGAYCRAPGQVLAVLTADCLPVLLCDHAGTEIALLHAGWRGLAAGILDAGLARLRAPPRALTAWLGPAIGPRAFEVGREVREAFVARDSALEACFTPGRPGRWQADLAGLARTWLQSRGVDTVFGGGHCTFEQTDAYFSYRRDGETGRMATLAWLACE